MLIVACSSNLRQEPKPGWFLRCNIFCALIACRTKRPEVGEFLFAADVLVYDVFDVKFDLSSCDVVNVAGNDAAHLAE